MRDLVRRPQFQPSQGGPRGIMPRYFFHLVSPTNPVRDTQGVVLTGLNAAHWHAVHLVYRLRTHAGEAGDDWVLEVGDESGAIPLVVLPWSVPLMRRSQQLE
jgi:hypothetical protein